MTAPSIRAAVPEELLPYCEARGGIGQLCQLIAVVEGIKPVLDDWVPAERLSDLASVAERFGLVLAHDEAFEPVGADDELGDVIGGDLLNTTRAVSGDPERTSGLVHVYLGREPADVEEASRSGWYNLIAGGRVVPKPWIDHHWLGQRLGYPPCCLRSFATHGAWNVANPYAAAAAATQGSAGAAANPAHRHTGLAYVVHYPCSFDCAPSVRLGNRVRDAVTSWSPALAAEVDRLVAGPHLMLSGWVVHGFGGAQLTGDRITYRSVRAAPTNRPDPSFTELLVAGDAVEVRGDVVLVWSGADLVGTRAVRADRYGPEHPVLVDFGWAAP